MDADFWRRFEYSFNLMHYYAWWLYHFGCMIFFGSIITLALSILQFIMIHDMKVLSTSNTVKMADLKKEL